MPVFTLGAFLGGSGGDSGMCAIDLDAGVQSAILALGFQ